MMELAVNYHSTDSLRTASDLVGHRDEMKLYSQFSHLSLAPTKVVLELKLKTFLQILHTQNCSGKHISTGKWAGNALEWMKDIQDTPDLISVLSPRHRREALVYGKGRTRNHIPCVCACADKGVSELGGKLLPHHFFTKLFPFQLKPYIFKSAFSRWVKCHLWKSIKLSN